MSHLWLLSLRKAPASVTVAKSVLMLQRHYEKQLSLILKWLLKKMQKTSVTIRLLQFSKSLRVKAANVTTK